MDKKNYIKGLLYGISAFTIWGLLPLYWKLVNALNPYQIFSQRVVWSFVFVLIVMAVTHKIQSFKDILKDRKNWLNVIGPALFISINWLVFIWAVSNNYLIETSLGYYINPLVLTMFGAVFFKERLNGLQKIGLGFATIGVLLKSITYGKIPYISLTLAISFSLYGLLKKKSKLKSLDGLGFETLVISIPSLLYLAGAKSKGLGIIGNLPWYFWLLIAFSGIATAVPLLFYSESTKLLPLNVVGFLQYIAPTIILLLGIFVYGESFDLYSLIAFILIWIGLGFFSYSQYRYLKQK